MKDISISRFFKLNQISMHFQLIYGSPEINGKTAGEIMTDGKLLKNQS
jgi:hypothetical protein